MRRQKKTPLERANTRAADGEHFLRGRLCTHANRISYIQDNTSQRRAQELFVWKYLGYGAETATTARDLAAMIGVSDPRVITRAIERERLNGIPICACDNGYYPPFDAEELERYLRAFQRRRSQMSRTETALRFALDRMAAQQTLNEGGADNG